MDRDAIRGAATRILISYVRTHQISADQLPELVAAVGQALSLHPTLSEAEISVPVRRYRRRQADIFPVADTRILHPDQPDMFGETAGEPEAEAETLPETQTKRGRRSRRDVAEAGSESTVEQGVTVTRIPEVGRKRR